MERISFHTPLIIERRVVAFPYSDPNVIGPITYREAQRQGWLSHSSGTVSVVIRTAEGGYRSIVKSGKLYAFIPRNEYGLE